jgi:hypothetical protein
MPEAGTMHIAVAERPSIIHHAPPPAVTMEMSAREKLERQVSRYYDYREPDAVRRFLIGHPRVSELLLEAEPKIREIFGGETGTRLWMINMDGEMWLYAAIRCRGSSVEEAIALLDRFDIEWPSSNHLDPLVLNLDFSE